MKKITKVLTLLFSIATLASCGVNGTNTTSSATNPSETSSTCTGSSCATGTIDLDAINDYFKNDAKWFDFNNNGNKVTLIPFTHINGPRYEWDFFAIVNFEYESTTYYKYQVTYLSCTCRSADVNYWQTAYVELSIPNADNDETSEDVKVREISFEKDGTGEYLAGFWGDSGMKDLEPTGIPTSNGVFYEDIRDDFIPYLVGKKYKDIKKLNVVEDIDATDFATKMNGKMFHDDHQVTLDDFSGASVSTNNIIRVLNALMEYHIANNI